MCLIRRKLERGGGYADESGLGVGDQSSVTFDSEVE